MRHDLGMRRGKQIAQGAHAAMKVLLDSGGEVHENYNTDLPPFCLDVFLTPDMKTWITDSFKKVCVRVESEEELLNVYQQALDAGLPCAIIKDEGKTEFHNVHTYTCCAIGPAKSVEIDKITAELKLL